MSRRIQLANTYSSRQLSSISQYLDIKKKELGIVIGIVLDDGDRSKELLSIFDLQDDDLPLSSFVGHIIVQRFADYVGGKFDLLPPYIEDSGYPIINETVRIIDDGGKRYYKRINTAELNSGNFRPEQSDTFFGSGRKEASKGENYKEVSDTGISNSQTSSGKIENEYFTPEFFHRLKLNEGDKLLQSRFGQSIRFSGYNNEERELSPTIIIRNRQNDISLEDNLTNKLVNEDVNRDGSIIVLSSNKYKIPFQPGIIDDGGSSNFKTTPINFELPEEYTGFDQMLLNSDRIILSAKSQEMIFFSKGDYGFISDGRFIIDNGESGADLDFGDDVNITTDRNDANFSIVSGVGQIRLNTDEQGNSPSKTGPQDASGQGSLRKEPLVRGQVLVDLLTELIDSINAQTFNTPSGPTAVGPNNRADFSNIKSKLRDALSTLNYTE